ncbi:hypothetical protein D9M68_882110 [compost metagenome]
MAFGDEGGQRGVRHQVAFAVELRVRGLERGRERLGQHQVADAQARVQGLAEGTHIDDGRVGLQPQQRGDGPTGKAELAVVVVLDDPTAALARHRQQLPPAGQRHDRAQRILVRGGNKNEARRRGDGLGQPHALFVHRQVHRMQAVGL